VITDNKSASMRKKQQTVASRFKEQLSSLVTTLSNTNPYYVRCIKPNTLKKPELFDRDMIMAQLRYAGMLETVRIRQLGYPVRTPFKDFFFRYKALAPIIDLTKNDRDRCAHLVNQIKAKLNPDHIQIGITKVFLRHTCYSLLEEMRGSALSKRATTIQAYYRMWIDRRQYKKYKKSAIKIQSIFRGFRQRTKYLRTQAAILTIQSVYRMYRKRKLFLNIRNKIKQIQSAVRALLIRNIFHEKLKEKREHEIRLKEIAKLKQQEERKRLEQEELDRQKKNKNKKKKNE